MPWKLSGNSKPSIFMQFSFLDLAKIIVTAKGLEAFVPMLGAIKDKRRNRAAFTPKDERAETVAVGFDPENEDRPTYVDISFLPKELPLLDQIPKAFGKGVEFPPTSPDNIYILRFLYSIHGGTPQVVIFATLTDIPTKPESRVKRLVLRRI